MQVKRHSTVMLLTLGVLANALCAMAGDATPSRRNIIIFVADGLRYGSVNATDAPTLLSIRERGINFQNSHSLFPTFTTPNASAIATGHYLGDSGHMGNTFYFGYPVFNTGNFAKTSGTITPFVEDDQILADLDEHYGGNYLNEESLLGFARQNGYSTAAIGKMGPVAVQDVAQISAEKQRFPVPRTVIIDDRTGSASGVPMAADIISALTAAGLSTVATARDQPAGTNVMPGTLKANIGQQQYFVDATTKAILPTFQKRRQPFLLLYWSRDPDGSQHSHGDSLNVLTPGINGPTSRAGIKNADNNLAQILAYINSDPQLAANTDIFITSDHGFATVSKHEIDNTGKRFSSSYSARFIYRDAKGGQEVNTGFLPAGYVAIDLAHALSLPLFDPDGQLTNSNGEAVYEAVDPTIPQQTANVRQYPALGNGLIGGSGKVLDGTDAKVIIATNGGTDLIYVPDHNFERVRQIVRFLSRQDYIGSIFVDDSYGRIPGALPLSAVNLIGTGKLPRPAIVISFKTFYLTPGDLQTAVLVADTRYQEGQGMHGSLGRDNTFNNMAAIGPDFKSNFVDRTPVSNADIAPTIAKIIGLELPANGKLRGRVLTEALKQGPDSTAFQHKKMISGESDSHKSTVLLYQQVEDRLYFDEACFVDGRQAARSNPCR